MSRLEVLNNNNAYTIKHQMNASDFESEKECWIKKREQVDFLIIYFYY